MKTPLHGLVAEFSTAETLLEATREAWRLGYRKMDAYTPYLVDGLAEALGVTTTGVPLLTLLGGIIGGATGLGMQVYSAAYDYPLNIGGRPLHSWPAFVPIAFELTILGACLAALFGMLALNRLPRPHHPIFDTPFFAERNGSNFYLCIEATDPLFDSKQTAAFLRTQWSQHVWEVPES
jgi:hypothetical protein